MTAPAMGRAVAFVALAALVGGCGMYRGFVYPAPEEGPPALNADFEPIETCDHDGAPVHAYLLAPPDARASVVVLLHGNGETMEHRAGLARDLRNMGYGVALVEYRGYGLSRGSPPPDERGLYLDASAVLELLAARGIGPDRIVLMGISLGTGVAAQMAACGAARALVLVSPFTSLTAAAHHVVSWLPTGWLVPDRYDTLGKAARIRIPTLVIHGDADDLVPVDMGLQVAEAIPRAELKLVQGAGHNDLLRLWRRPVLDAIGEFLARRQAGVQ